MNWKLALVTFSLIGGLWGCSTVQPRTSDPFAPGVHNAALLIVDNRNFQDADIDLCWAETGCQRLDLVTGKTVKRFYIDIDGTRLRLRVDLIGADSYYTDWQHVVEGERLELQIWSHE